MTLLDPLAYEQYLVDGYARVPSAVPPARVHTALRLLGQEVRNWGLDPALIPEWDRATWFPTLREHPAVLALRATLALPAQAPSATWATPQLCVRLPDNDPIPGADGDNLANLVPHQDRSEDGDPFALVAGVVLTDHTLSDGALAVWPGSHLAAAPPGPLDSPVLVPALSGDVIFMHPNLYHCGTLNLGAYPRVVTYFRAAHG